MVIVVVNVRCTVYGVCVCNDRSGVFKMYLSFREQDKKKVAIYLKRSLHQSVVCGEYSSYVKGRVFLGIAIKR